MKRGNLGKDKSEKEQMERAILNRHNLKRETTNLKNDNSGKNKLNRGIAGNGKSEKGQL